ncbi:unnamed protein product [Sphagnum balticum]
MKEVGNREFAGPLFCRWPQIVLTCYGLDVFGNSVVRGYGAVHVPLTAGRHCTRLAMFAPVASSALQQLAGWMTGRRPEFVDSRFVAQATSRDVSRVATGGWCQAEPAGNDSEADKSGADPLSPTAYDNSVFAPDESLGRSLATVKEETRSQVQSSNNNGAKLGEE